MFLAVMSRAWRVNTLQVVCMWFYSRDFDMLLDGAENKIKYGPAIYMKDLMITPDSRMPKKEVARIYMSTVVVLMRILRVIGSVGKHDGSRNTMVQPEKILGCIKFQV